MKVITLTQREKQWLISAMVWLMGLWIAWTVGHWVADDQMNFVIFAGVGVVLVSIALMILRNWRRGFYFFVVWLLFEDLIRKYLGNNMAIFFAKDVLVGLCYISLLLAIRRKEVKVLRPPFLLVFMLFFWLAVLQVFNPYSPSPLYGLLGLKVDFFYVPLMFVSYALIRDERDLHRFLLVFILLALAISGLGILQAMIGPTFLNPATLQRDIRELGSLQKVTPLTDQAFFLPCGVFVSSGRFALYLILAVIIGMGTAAYFVLSSLRGRTLTYIGIGAIAVAVMLSGSRSAFLFSLISVLVLCAALLWGAPWRWGRGRRLVKAIRRSLIFASLGLAAFILLFPAAAGSRLNFYSQTLLPSSSAYELGDRSWTYPMEELGKALSAPHSIVGNGTGTATLGLQYVSELLKRPAPNVAVEEGMGQLIAEMGVLAPILWILLGVAVLRACWSVARSLKETRFFPIGVAIVWYVFLLLFALTYLSIDAYQNYVNNAFCWLLIGILYRLPDLVQQDDVAAIAAAEAPNS
ncbi:MAG TPA: hypothetical protein VFU57_11355 [Candidatus Acidoferrales bacterium]|nr:hypothetical protein [Candidatus Acidoferrales bacterium]